MKGNPKPPTEEEQKAQEIIDAIKKECGLDLKNPRNWDKQVLDIAYLQKELQRDTEDFVSCVNDLVSNPYYRSISLNLVLKTIRLMPTNAMRNQDSNEEEEGYISKEYAYSEIYKQRAKQCGTTPEIERAKHEAEQRAVREAIARGEII